MNFDNVVSLSLLINEVLKDEDEMKVKLQLKNVIFEVLYEREIVLNLKGI